MKQQQAGHILPTAQSHLDKRLPQSTSYVYRNEISRTLFNLQVRAMRKPIGWQILDNCFVCFRSSTGGEPRKTNKGKKREIWRHLVLLFMSCCWIASDGFWWGLLNFWSFIIWHHVSPSHLFSFCLVSKTFLETRLPRPEFVQNQISNYQIIPTVWSIRNVNICWWWSCYNNSYGCCVKLFCWSLISVITG